MATNSFVSTDIDYERDGKQVSVLRLPYSHNGSAWGIIPIPAAVIKNGKGPTVLLTAGIHGDEYEGQITLSNLIRVLEPSHIAGRVIIIPAVNYPAAIAGARVSPIDNINLNRTFPGTFDGSPTSQIAHYVSSVLLPMTDAMMDLHSGGSSMDVIPTGIMYRAKTPELMAKVVGAARVWGCPITMVMDDLGETRTVDGLCRDLGIVKLGTELSGGGGASPEALAIAETGIWNLLRYFGVLAAEPPAPRRLLTRNIGTRLMEITGPEAHVYASRRCLFEPNFALGDEVRVGEIAGWQHDLDAVDSPPAPLTFGKSGMVSCCNARGRVYPGDLVAVVVSDVDL
jgi:predicted deacylase